MKANKLKIVKAQIIAFLLLLIYLIYRSINILTFWRGIPNFETWHSYNDFELVKKAFNQVAVFSFLVTLELLLNIYMIWWVSIIAILLTSIIIYLVNLILAKIYIKRK